MIKKTICILLLLGAVAATVFVVLNRENTHTLLPLPEPKSVVEQIELPITPEPEVLIEEADSLVVTE